MSGRTFCHANRDGDCTWKRCPQILDGFCGADGEPKASIPFEEFRNCPLPDPRDYNEDEE